MHEVLVNRLGGLNLPRKSVTLDVYRGRKTTTQQQQQPIFIFIYIPKITINNNTPHLKSPENQNIAPPDHPHSRSRQLSSQS